jgi:hypothetical protein
MNLEYGKKDTYKHELDKERLNQLTNATNRSNAQTQFLFQLCDGDFEKLKLLEYKLKNSCCFVCPDTKEEVDEILTTKEDGK